MKTSYFIHMRSNIQVYPFARKVMNISFLIYDDVYDDNDMLVCVHHHDMKDTNDDEDEVDNEGAIMQHKFFLPWNNNRGRIIAFIFYVIIDI